MADEPPEYATWLPVIGMCELDDPEFKPKRKSSPEVDRWRAGLSKNEQRTSR
jgi:hypothetical protein